MKRNLVRWTELEDGKIRELMTIYPDLIPKDEALKNIPARTLQAIRTRTWFLRKLMSNQVSLIPSSDLGAAQDRAVEKKIGKKKLLDQFVSFLDEVSGSAKINGEAKKLMRQKDDRIKELTKEVSELKDILRKLKDVRAAVEKLGGRV